MYCEHIDSETKQVFGLTAKRFENYIPVGETEYAYDGRCFLKGCAPEKPRQVKETEIRKIRDSYLKQYVDPKQLVLVWAQMSDTEKADISAYRSYLLDYPADGANWFEKPPLTLDQWKK